MRNRIVQLKSETGRLFFLKGGLWVDATGTEWILNAKASIKKGWELTLKQKMEGA